MYLAEGSLKKGGGSVCFHANQRWSADSKAVSQPCSQSLRLLFTYLPKLGKRLMSQRLKIPTGLSCAGFRCKML